MIAYSIISDDQIDLEQELTPEKTAILRFFFSGSQVFPPSSSSLCVTVTLSTSPLLQKHLLDSSFDGFALSSKETFSKQDCIAVPPLFWSLGLD